jgi:hypothetical protein
MERLSYLALAEFHAGRCDLAGRLIEQSCDTIEERLEVTGRFAYPFAWRSLMDAYRGRFDRARQTLVPLLAGTAQAQKSWWAAVLLSVLGFVEFAAGDYRAADAVTRVKLKFKVVAGGVTVQHEGWTTDLFEQRDGRWQVVWSQTTAVPNNLDLFIQSLQP